MTASQLPSRPSNTHSQSHDTRRQSQLRGMQSPDLGDSKPPRRRSTSLQNTIDCFPSRPPQPQRPQAHPRLRLGRRPTRPDPLAHPRHPRCRSIPIISSLHARRGLQPHLHNGRTQAQSGTRKEGLIGRSSTTWKTVPLPAWRGNDPSASGWTTPDTSGETKWGSASLWPCRRHAWRFFGRR